MSFYYEPIGLVHSECRCTGPEYCRHKAIVAVRAILDGRFAAGDTPLGLHMLADELHAAASQWERGKSR